VIDGLKDLPFAPSMPIKSIPSKSLGERLGMGVAELNEPEDDVEAKVKSTSYLLFWGLKLIGRATSPQKRV
jgi:hypothetical protein